MSIGLPWADAIGLVAGILIIVVGLFVLAAKPSSGFHRLFFLLATMDGMSTLLFRLGVGTQDAFLRSVFVGSYFYFFLAFITLLGLFGVVFPKPPVHPTLRRGILGGILAAGGGLALLYTIEHDLFWSLDRAAGDRIVVEPLGNVVAISFVAVVSLLLVRVTSALLREQSESHRRQAAYVLGGMSLAYLPYPWTITVQDVSTLGWRIFTDGRWDRVVAHWVLVAACLAMLASALLFARRLRPEVRDERAFVYACYGGVLSLAGLTLVIRTDVFAATLRSLALLAYPVLLGFAIARYEVFDIDKQLRRAATVSLTAAAMGISFFLAEEFAANLFQERLADTTFGGGASSTILAALVTAAIFIPAARFSKRVAGRIVPELGDDEIRVRKLEIYRHSLSGALADGILMEGESRTLAALRATLGISDADHQRLIAEVRA